MRPFGTSRLAPDALRMPTEWQVGVTVLKGLEVQLLQRDARGRPLLALLGQNGTLVSAGTSTPKLMNAAFRGRRPSPEPGLLWAWIVSIITPQHVPWGSSDELHGLAAQW